MSIGLVVSILILSAILGLLAKQTLAIPKDVHQEQNQDEESSHSHAI